MNEEMSELTHGSEIPTLTVLAWGVMLIGSLLPNIVWFELTGTVPPWLIWIKLTVLGAFSLIALSLKALRPLVAFTIVLLVYLAASMFTARFEFGIPSLQRFLGDGSFIRQLQPEQFRNLTVSLVILIVLLALGYSRRRMFLTPGHVRQPITPVKWLGFPKPDSWVSFGGQYSVYLALGTGAALWLTSGISPGQLGGVLPSLPAILLMASLNAFNEEFVYRSSVLATLETRIGKKQVGLLSATFFGIAHFWGVPSGFLGIALATFMGWILTKAMLETRGFFWSWWIHFLQDVAIFTFLVAGSQ
ncbi:CPBP family intramembrane metalloprotease [candidate division KSB3 bacterium]|nr:CPBP family intramembrane metalloprotease [candidate division KSB3 bacterium]